MRRPNALVKVAGPAAILGALGWTLWLWPAHFLWIYPASGALFIWFSWSGEREVKYIFLFLVTAAGFILPKLAPGGDSLYLMAGALAEVLCLWLLFYALSSSETSRQAARDQVAAEQAEAAQRVRDLMEQDEDARALIQGYLEAREAEENEAREKAAAEARQRVVAATEGDMAVATRAAAAANAVKASGG